MPIDCIGPEAAAWFDAASRDKPGAAHRAFENLRSMMFRAEECDFRERGTNPCVGIKNPRRNIARFLDTDELARLGRARRPRRGEVLNLRWRDIGKDAIKLPDAKTGPRAVPLGEAARALIDALLEPRDPGVCLFTAPCRRPRALDTRRLLAHGLRRREARQGAVA